MYITISLLILHSAKICKLRKYVTSIQSVIQKKFTYDVLISRLSFTYSFDCSIPCIHSFELNFYQLLRQFFYVRVCVRRNVQKLSLTECTFAKVFLEYLVLSHQNFALYRVFHLCKFYTDDMSMIRFDKSQLPCTQ